MTKRNALAVHVDDVFREAPPQPAGAFEYFHAGPGFDEIAGMLFVCPCGCGEIYWIAFRGHQAPGRPAWDWDGNRDSPTLTPSLHLILDCGWHGFLRAGVFEEIG